MGLNAQVLDSAAVIPAAEMFRFGWPGKVRYVSGEPSKNYSPAEQAEDQKFGIEVSLVCEDGAADFANGANAGAAKAQEIKPLLAALNWPADRPVYAAIDFQPSVAEFPGCWAGIFFFAKELGRPTAAYADWPLLAYCQIRGLHYGWAVGASSFNTGQRPSCVVLQQRAQQVTVGGVVCDLNDVLAEDWGQVPAPVPPPPPVPEGTDMDVLRITTAAPAGKGLALINLATLQLWVFHSPDEANYYKDHLKVPVENQPTWLIERCTVY